MQTVDSENKGTKVSVIIPVFNQAIHIKECLESVSKQTLKEIEIIVIDGGSNDQTTEIVKEHQVLDQRVVLLSATPGSIPEARQEGLKIAKGEYILYLDGDDRLVEDALELLYDKGTEADAEMVVLNFIIENRFCNTLTESNSDKFVRISGIDFIRSLYEHKNYWMVWSVFHKRSLYNNPISFDNSLYLGEDTLLTTQLAYYSKKVMKINCKPLLYHTIHKDAETKKKCFTQKKCFDLEVFPQLIRDFLKDKPEFDRLEESWCCLRLDAIVRSFKYNHYQCCQEKSREALDILNKYPALRKKMGSGITPMFRMFSISENLGKAFSKIILQ